MSIHRGTIINNVDPAIRGRIQVRVPSVSPEASAWAIPVLPLGVLAPAAPAPIGAAVWVMYEDDDAEHPVVLGFVPPVGGIAPAAPAAELGQDDG